MNVGNFSNNSMSKKMEEMKKDSLMVVGETEINGYACTQVNVITTLNLSSAMARAIGGDGKTVTKYWLSKDVPGYKMMKEMLKKRPKMLNGSDAKVYEYGIPVKQETIEDGKVNMVMELKTAEQKDIPNKMFEIPKAYKES